MDNSDIVSSIGLAFDIVGVVILFKYGLPAEVRKTGGFILGWGTDEPNEKAEREYRFYKRMSRIGLGSLILGFGLQIVSNFLS